MKHILLIILFFVSCTSSFAQNLLPRPNPPMLVNDEAKVLSDYDREALESRLVAFDDSTSNQIAIVTIPTLNDYPIEDYANKLLRAWGIGNKKTNNGLLILVAVNDHNMRIEVGYGLEGAIPDVTASDIVNNDMKPAFKQGDYYTGLSNAVESLAQAAAGEYHISRGKSQDGGGSGWVVFIIIMVVVLIIIGRSGRGGGGMMSRRGSGWFIWPLLFSNFGDSGRSSGSWGGGSGGGGGFGGFGGGSSGGGGASGSW